MKPRTITRAFAACAIAMLASGCADGGSGPTVTPPSPFGTEPAPVTGSEPTIGGNDSLPPVTGSESTIGGNDSLPGQERSLRELCSAACSNLESGCPDAVGVDCQQSCLGAGSSYPTCAAEFRAYVACVATAPIFCSGPTLQIPACDSTESALEYCANSTGR
jgi:hypothetical protein